MALDQEDSPNGGSADDERFSSLSGDRFQCPEGAHARRSEKPALVGVQVRELGQHLEGRHRPRRAAVGTVQHAPERVQQAHGRRSVPEEREGGRKSFLSETEVST